MKKQTTTATATVKECKAHANRAELSAEQSKEYSATAIKYAIDAEKSLISTQALYSDIQRLTMTAKRSELKARAYCIGAFAAVVANLISNIF